MSQFTVHVTAVEIAQAVIANAVPGGVQNWSKSTSRSVNVFALTKTFENSKPPEIAVGTIGCPDRIAAQGKCCVVGTTIEGKPEIMTLTRTFCELSQFIFSVLMQARTLFLDPFENLGTSQQAITESTEETKLMFCAVNVLLNLVVFKFVAGVPLVTTAILVDMVLTEESAGSVAEPQFFSTIWGR